MLAPVDRALGLNPKPNSQIVEQQKIKEVYDWEDICHKTVVFDLS